MCLTHCRSYNYVVLMINTYYQLYLWVLIKTATIFTYHLCISSDIAVHRLIIASLCICQCLEILLDAQKSSRCLCNIWSHTWKVDAHIKWHDFSNKSKAAVSDLADWYARKFWQRKLHKSEEMSVFCWLVQMYINFYLQSINF